LTHRPDYQMYASPLGSQSLKKKQSNKTPTPPLHIHCDCPTTTAACSDQIDQICLAHNIGYAEAQRYYIIPFWFLYTPVYQYPLMLPLAMACPLPPEAPKEAVSPEAPQAPRLLDFSQQLAFKLVFCPQGLDVTVKHIKMEPKFSKNHSFISRTWDFFKNWFIHDKKEVVSAITKCSSVWVADIVKEDRKWVHQILATVLYTYSGPTEQSSFIEYLAVQDSRHDANVEFHPVISPDVYNFEAGKIAKLQDKLVTLNDMFPPLSENLGGPQNHVEGRRIGAVLLCLIQCLHNVDEAQLESERVPYCTLYLQANIPTFAYRRYCRIGFQYSQLHFQNLEGTPNQNWPLCTDPKTDLPPGLGQLVQSYCAGEDAVNMILLTTKEPLLIAYPPTQVFGSLDCLEESIFAKTYHAWRTGCLLCDPISCMSCNYTPPQPNLSFLP
jgi:hypothetical protein